MEKKDILKYCYANKYDYNLFLEIINDLGENNENGELVKTKAIYNRKVEEKVKEFCQQERYDYNKFIYIFKENQKLSTYIFIEDLIRETVDRFVNKKNRRIIESVGGMTYKEIAKKNKITYGKLMVNRLKYAEEFKNESIENIVKLTVEILSDTGYQYENKHLYYVCSINGVDYFSVLEKINLLKLKNPEMDIENIISLVINEMYLQIMHNEILKKVAPNNYDRYDDYLYEFLKVDIFSGLKSVNNKSSFKEIVSKKCLEFLDFKNELRLYCNVDSVSKDTFEDYYIKYKLRFSKKSDSEIIKYVYSDIGNSKLYAPVTKSKDLSISDYKVMYKNMYTNPDKIVKKSIDSFNFDKRLSYDLKIIESVKSVEEICTGNLVCYTVNVDDVKKLVDEGYDYKVAMKIVYYFGSDFNGRKDLIVSDYKAFLNILKDASNDFSSTPVAVIHKLNKVNLLDLNDLLIEKLEPLRLNVLKKLELMYPIVKKYRKLMNEISTEYVDDFIRNKHIRKNSTIIQDFELNLKILILSSVNSIEDTYQAQYLTFEEKEVLNDLYSGLPEKKIIFNHDITKQCLRRIEQKSIINLSVDEKVINSVKRR